MTSTSVSGVNLFGTSGKRNVYGYNDDDEVDRYNHATSGGTLADDWTYTYDGIGNRLSAVGPDTGDGANISYTYTPSNTNSYTQIKRGGANQNPVYDKDGNMTDRGNLDFIWDGEPRRLAGAEMDFRRKPGGRDERGARASQNRLIEVQGTGSTVKYEYDYLGRRVKRTAGGSTETYVYDGWNLVVSYTGGSTRKHTYTWGTDNGTGGIGALIACRKISNGKDHVYFYDGHGNVTQVMNQSGTIVAHYEYDAFGNLTKNVNQDGSGFNNENPFRFSTKFFNDETDHYYYGYRHYDPRDGRWLNRDPLGERGGASLYAFVFNSAVNNVDPDGRATVMLQDGIHTTNGSSEDRGRQRPSAFSIIGVYLNVGSVIDESECCKESETHCCIDGKRVSRSQKETIQVCFRKADVPEGYLAAAYFAAYHTWINSPSAGEVGLGPLNAGVPGVADGIGGNNPFAPTSVNPRFVADYVLRCPRWFFLCPPASVAMINQ